MSDEPHHDRGPSGDWRDLDVFLGVLVATLIATVLADGTAMLILMVATAGVIGLGLRLVRTFSPGRKLRRLSRPAKRGPGL
ncbi:MAG: hypothetical protein M3401_08965 [Actinomycetota bacterium]|nr:hypothetical protein [Actinomycetota bacterium]